MFSFRISRTVYKHLWEFAKHGIGVQLSPGAGHKVQLDKSFVRRAISEDEPAHCAEILGFILYKFSSNTLINFLEMFFIQKITYNDCFVVMIIASNAICPSNANNNTKLIWIRFTINLNKHFWVVLKIRYYYIYHRNRWQYLRRDFIWLQS